jgi:hypothetical protein
MRIAAPPKWVAARFRLGLTLATAALGLGCGSSGASNSPIDGGPIGCAIGLAACADDAHCATTLDAALAAACADACGPGAVPACLTSVEMVQGPNETFIDYYRADSYTRYAYAADGSLVGIVTHSTMTTPAWTCTGVAPFDAIEAMTVAGPPGPSGTGWTTLRAACAQGGTPD